MLRGVITHNSKCIMVNKCIKFVVNTVLVLRKLECDQEVTVTQYGPVRPGKSAIARVKNEIGKGIERIMTKTRVAYFMKYCDCMILCFLDVITLEFCL